MELNIRFLSSLSPEWKRTVKNVRQSLDLDEVDLYTIHDHLQQFVNDTAEPEIADPFALVMETQTRSTTKTQKKKKAVVMSEEDEGSDEEIDMESEMAELQKKMALLTKQYNRRFIKKNTSSNKLRTSSSNYKPKRFEQNSSEGVVAAEEPPKCFNCGKPGHLIKDCRLPRRRDFNYYKQKMLLNKQKMFMAKQEDENAALLAEKDHWMEDDSSDEEEENLALMAIVEKDERKGDAAIPRDDEGESSNSIEPK
ncbi:unnamed protein product [Cuscuta epithymum]|nr:unnamed protein product [Cuscuta epithymum]CAH9142487.1 unnamed protein product [Cuscuta epithymum]